MHIKSVICFVLLISLLPTLKGQPRLVSPPENIATQLSKMISALKKGKAPGAGIIVRVLRPGQWEWTFAEGINNRSVQSLAKPDLVFRAASISKLFCATAVLKLASEGVLSVDDKIASWLPAAYTADFSNKDKITIKDLLCHTSGIGEVQAELNLFEDPDKNYTDTLLTIISALNNKGLGYGQFFYSNSNYVLLTKVVEKASALSYKEYLNRNIISPLSLNDTYVDALPEEKRFIGYVPGFYIPGLAETDTLIDYSDMSVSWGPGAADISSTTKDLVSFYSALQSGKIIPMRWVDSMVMHKAGPFNKQFYDYYGYGTMLQQKEGTPFAVGHTGNGAGYTNLLCHLLPTDVFVCVSFNRHGVDPRFFKEFLEKINDILATTNMQTISLFSF